MERVLFWIKKFSQHSDECAIAACASIGHFYNPEIDYEHARTLVQNTTNGLVDVEQGILLNDLGFDAVSVVSGDTAVFDPTWQNRGRQAKINRLEAARKHYAKSDQRASEYMQICIDFLRRSKSNRLVIDWDYAKWLRKIIGSGNPVAAVINQTSFRRMPRFRNSRNGERPDDIRGDPAYNAIVLRGYTDTHLFVVDSDPNRSYYKVRWTDLLLNVNSLILVGIS